MTGISNKGVGRSCKVAMAALLLALCAAPAMAQDHPKVEAFGGYSYTRFNLDGDPAGVVHINLNGGIGSVAFNPSKAFGFVVEFGGSRFSKVKQAGVTAGIDGTIVSYLFGPRITLRRERVAPFAHFLLGGVHRGKLTSNDPNVCGGPGTCNPLPSENAFAMVLGGGVDVKAGKHVSIRLAQVDYFMTRFKDLSNTPTRATQNNFRYAVGIVLH